MHYRSSVSLRCASAHKPKKQPGPSRGPGETTVAPPVSDGSGPECQTPTLTRAGPLVEQFLTPQARPLSPEKASNHSTRACGLASDPPQPAGQGDPRHRARYQARQPSRVPRCWPPARQRPFCEASDDLPSSSRPACDDPCGRRSHADPLSPTKNVSPILTLSRRTGRTHRFCTPDTPILATPMTPQARYRYTHKPSDNRIRSRIPLCHPDTPDIRIWG